MRSVRAGLVAVGLLLGVIGCSRPAPDADRPATAVAAPSEPPSAAPASTTPRDEPMQAPTVDETPRRDLSADERLGGHTLARHVGLTDAQLQSRLDRERIAAASTYPDRETAERVVATALAANARRIQRWVDEGARSPLAIRYRARDGLPTGRSLRRGQRRSTTVTGATVVLRQRGDEVYVLTSYPEEPR